MTTAAFQMSTALLQHLATPALRALALGVGAALGLAVFRVKTTSVRLFTWTSVLYVALAMPLLERMLPPLSVPTPAFLRYQASGPKQVSIPQSQAVAATRTSIDRKEIRGVAVKHFSPVPSTIRWDAIAVGIYFGLALVLVARLFIGLAFARRLRLASQVIHDNRLTGKLASRTQATGLSCVPQAAESEVISVPVTMGILRPTILLPDTWREWDDTKLDAVIAHEMSHVARRDTLTQRLSHVHCAIFWFSPLAWWIKRHLADLAEQASDEAALSCGADRKDYARTLLGFFETLQGTQGRIWWQGVSMANAGRAEQRVERILAWRGMVTMRLKKSIAIVIVLIAVPVVYLAASVQPANQSTLVQSTQLVQLAQNQASNTPSTPPAAAHASKKSSTHSSYSYQDDDAERFVIVSGNSDSLTMSGTQDDGERVEQLRKTIPGDFIWFRREGKAYIIRDQATIDRVKAFWAPQEELGKKQEELGKQQEALGKQQEELGTKMEQVRVNVPDLTKEMEKLQAQLTKLGPSATLEQVGELQSAIGDLQGKIGDIQSEAGDQQGKLGEQMGALGEKQGKLGEQQGELGRQQGELAKQATRQMKQIFDEALSKGTAKIEPEEGRL